MRLIHSLQLFVSFLSLVASVPAPGLQHDSFATSIPPDLLERVLRLTESRLHLRDAALAVLRRASGVSKRSQDEERVDKRYSWASYFPRPFFSKPRPHGMHTRDFSSQISKLLAQLEESFNELAQVIYDQLDIPTPTPEPSFYRCSSTLIAPSTTVTTPSLYPDRPASTLLQPLTSSEASLVPLILPTPATPTPSNTPSSYIFNPDRPDLNIAYYSQSPPTTSVPFLNICNDASIDIINLAFVTDFFTAGGYPTLNLASKCWGLDPNTTLGAAAKAKGATGLIDCISPGFAAQVTQCQALGKKVMLSLGGSKDYSNTAIPSQQKAVELANTLWSLFLGGTDPNLTPLRPFGANVVLDGIDIDNEIRANAANFPILTSTLRSLFQASHFAGSKPFYLSAAPQCPHPDASIPISSMIHDLDFVSVQFYNNPSCNLGTSGFIDSLKVWSADIANYNVFHNVGNGLTAPRLLIGVPADPGAADAGGYVNQATWQTTLQQVKALGLGNIGGAMYWDGSYLELNKAGGQSFADVLRNVF